MRNRWFGHIALIVISVGVGLLMCEGAIRLWVMSVAPNLMVLDHELGWTHRRNVRRTYHVEGVDAVVDMNELGLRGTVYTGPSQHQRVLVLGDSFADGLEVSNEDLFSVIWDRHRPDLEVVNAGVGGYGTLQALLRLRQLESLIRPDLCVLMVFDNDLSDNIMPFYPSIGARPYVDGQGEIKPARWELFEPLLLARTRCGVVEPPQLVGVFVSQSILVYHPWRIPASVYPPVADDGAGRAEVDAL